MGGLGPSSQYSALIAICRAHFINPKLNPQTRNHQPLFRSESIRLRDLGEALESPEVLILKGLL